MTATADPALEERGLASGAHVVLAKLLDADALFTASSNCSSADGRCFRQQRR